MAIALDGSVSANATSGSTKALPGLTTTNGNVVVFMAVLINGTPGAVTISSITDTAGLTWTLRKRLSSCGGTASQSMETWYATSVAALSSNIITLHLSGSVTYLTAIAFGISGANTTTPFDVNGGLPVSTAAAASTSVSLSTTATNSMVIGAFRQSSNGSPTAGSGFTTIVGNFFTLAEYKIVSVAQSGLSITETASNDANGIIGDAVVSAVQVSASTTAAAILLNLS